MFRFLTSFWLPIEFLLVIYKSPAAGIWLALPVLLIPAWLLYCLLAD